MGPSLHRPARGYTRRRLRRSRAAGAGSWRQWP
jgi:hypothetical protein